MAKIGKLFHLTHLVTDLDAADRWYDKVFSAQRYYRGYMKAALRDASLVCVGDLVLEPIQVAKVPGAEKSPVGKFYARFGQRFHSIAWYVDQAAGLFAPLTKQHIRLYDMLGNKLTDANQSMALWTHPKDAHSLLEFAPSGEFNLDPRLHPAWSSTYWRDQHPLGIDRTSHITVTFADLKNASGLYGEALGGKLIHEEEIPGHKRSAFFAVGEDTIVEAAQPLSMSTPEGRDMEKDGEGVFAVTFKTLNLARAAKFLESKGQRIESQDAHSLTLNTQDTFGMTIGFTDRSLPNDPR
jgi:catechol 2,3-dioxygenase-like lactoylglutathione lyase family enzyme